MARKSLLIIAAFIFILSGSKIPAQSAVSPEQEFIKSLLSDTSDVSRYLDKNDLQKSERLGIRYEGVRYKFLISYDIDPVIKDQVQRDIYTYKVSNEKLEDDFSKITFSTNEADYKKEFYFRGGRLTDPSNYFTRKWHQYDSKYFRILASDASLYNNYSVFQLDNFTDALLRLLRFTNEDKQLLEKNKVYYILCRDQEEIKRITGFDTRGIYILAYDQIITTYNCHFHELAHLLINMKLKRLPLYTLPLFQEGFATATGGRGGISRDVLLDIGRYLQKSGFVQLNSILTKKDFQQEDASMTYPVAAVYNYFLMNEYGMEPYLELYLNNSGSEGMVAGFEASDIKLPPLEKFTAFIETYREKSGVSPDFNIKGATVVYEGNAGMVYLSGDNYIFRIRKNMLLTDKNPLLSYKSRKFAELFPGTTYRGQKYLITADSMEVNVYNLFTNNLIASYAAGYSLSVRKVTSENGYFTFSVSKSVFDEELKELSFTGL